MPNQDNSVDREKNWLKRLKEESWEAELLVSIASIFAIFKAFDFLDWAVDLFINKLLPSQYFIGYMICFMGYIAFGILGSFFVIHFGLRAYWIGLVGLNSVFPDYSIENSAYSKVYTQKMAEKLPKLKTTIEQLDEVCSVIFSTAFTLLLVYAYLGIIASVYLLLFNVLSEYVSTRVLLAPLFIVGLTYVVMTFISIYANLKQNKEKTRLQLWYYKIGIFGSSLFYGPLYKYILQTSMIFGSNFKKKKALVKATLLMALFGFALGVFQIFESNVTYLLTKEHTMDTSRAYSQYYSNNNLETSFLLAPEIKSISVTNEPLQLFVPFFSHETKTLKNSCGIEQQLSGPRDSKDKQQRWSTIKDCYQKALQIQLNGQEIMIDFLKTDHFRTNQFGLQGFIESSSLLDGKNELIITKSIDGQAKKKWSILFFNNSIPRL